MIFDKLKKFDIVFDSPEVDCPPVFSSGDVVSGRVVVDLCGESRVDSLKLHAEGFAKVHWTESRSAGSSTAYTQNFSDEVEYLNRREVLLQAGQSALRARCFGGRQRSLRAANGVKLGASRGSKRQPREGNKNGSGLCVWGHWGSCLSANWESRCHIPIEYLS